MGYKTANSFHYDQTVAAASWVITHNLNTNAPVIDIWVLVGADLTKILPQNVVVTDVNTVTLTFTVDYTGHAVVVA